MDTRRAVSLVGLLLAACTACAGLEDDNKVIPYDSEEACLRVAGADWRNSTCACSHFHLPTPNRTSCIPRLANAAKACELSEQCADVTQFGECSSGVCICPDKFHYRLGRCWLSAGLGDSCTRDEDCHVNYDPLSATCGPDGKCECSYGYYTRGNIDCRRVADAVGSECGIDNDCKIPGGACNADNRTCYASKAIQDSEDKQYLADSSNTTSATTVTASSQQSSVSAAQTSASTTGSPAGSILVGAECASDASCSDVENSRCFGRPGRCECLPGFFGDDGSSACVREIGEPCDSAKNCSGIDFAECRNSTCVCLVGYIAISNNRACKQAKAYGISCSPKFPEQCSSYGSRCECLDKPTGEAGQQCLCASGYHFVKKENLCWVSRGLNDRCKADLDCVVDVGRAVCANGTTCQCSPGLRLSHDGSQCVNVTALGDECSTSEDCSTLGQNIECSANKCRCVTHYYESGGDNRACLPGLGAPCASNSSCSRENSVCKDEACVCGGGYVASNDKEKCLEVAKKIGSSCSEQQQCTQSFGDLSLCRESQCVCGDDDQFREGQCRDKKAPGDKCKNNAECYVTNNVSFVECRNELCECKYGYTLSSKYECISAGAVPPTAVSTSTLLWALLAAASHLTVSHPLYLS